MIPQRGQRLKATALQLGAAFLLVLVMVWLLSARSSGRTAETRRLELALERLEAERNQLRSDVEQLRSELEGSGE